MRNTATIARTLLLILAAALSAPAVADPPAHAPAHGWRKKNDARYVGHTGKHWEHDYGILSGSCNRQAVATAIGGVVGAVVGARVAEPESRTIAALIGAAAGAFIGNRIGRHLDEADRGCVAHALEVGSTGQRVTWTNESTGVHYEMTPGRDRRHDGAACRDYTLRAVAGAQTSTERGLACQSREGAWEVIE